MNTLERIIDLVKQLPDDQASEVLDFAEFIRMKHQAEDAEDLADAQAVLDRIEAGTESVISWDSVKAGYGLPD